MLCSETRGTRPLDRLPTGRTSIEATTPIAWHDLRPMRRVLALKPLAGMLALAAVLLLALPGGAHALEQRLVASDGADGDGFGRSVAIEGDTAVVGAPTGPDYRGAVYVFTRSGDSWTQSAKLTASDRESGGRIGSSLAIDGDTIVAGAPDIGPGAAYTFERTGAGWTQSAKLTASDGAGADQLGYSVAIDGDTIVAGADPTGVAPDPPGSVYTFARTGPAERTETAKLTASDGEGLGASVAIDGDTIVAGAPASRTAAPRRPGSAYTFERTGAGWTQSAKLTASDGTALDDLGSSVAVDGDTIVAGASGDGAGAVYTFARTGAAARTETAKLTAADGEASDSLGWSVAVGGDAIVAGAPHAIVAGAPLGSGSVYTFARTGAAERTEIAKLVGDTIGYSVAIDGDTIVAGAPQYRTCHLSDCSGPGYASVFSTTANAFSLGEVKRNKKKGTAKLGVNVPGPGELDLAKTRRVKHRGKRAPAEGEVMLAIKPRRKAKRALGKQGRAWVGAEVTYTPDGGEPNTESKRLKLIKRR
jgi:hypothetical protein